MTTATRCSNAAAVDAWVAAVSASVRAVAASSTEGRFAVTFFVSPSGKIGYVSVSDGAFAAMRAAVAAIGFVAPPPSGRTTHVTVPVWFRAKGDRQTDTAVAPATR